MVIITPGPESVSRVLEIENRSLGNVKGII